MRIANLPSREPEVFATVQGEGVSCGVPSVFVRLADCSLRCAWCDTAYTWDWSRYDRAVETRELSVEEVVAAVRRVAGDGVRSVVFTGGEPLLQQRELAAAAGALRAVGFRVEVETNGTLAPDEALAAAVDQWNVSPKLTGSGNPEKARLRPAALGWFAARPEAFFKLVVASPQDLDEATALVGRLGVPRSRVILMPEGVDAATLAERSRWLAEACTARGFRLGPRLHVHIWGSERGR